MSHFNEHALELFVIIIYVTSLYYIDDKKRHKERNLDFFRNCYKENHLKVCEKYKNADDLQVRERSNMKVVKTI